MSETPLTAPVRQLGFLQTCAIIIGTVIGSGVFISLPIVARIAGSPGMSILIWGVAGLLWIPQLLVLAEMSTAYPIQGGPYVYLRKAGSPFLAFFYVWAAFLTSDTPTITIISLSAISAIAAFSPLLTHPLEARVAATVIILVLTALHVRSVKMGGAIQIGLTAAKLLPLGAVVVIGFARLAETGGGGFFAGDALRHPGVLAAGISSTVWSYAGFPNILYMGGEVRSPERNLPRAMLGSLAVVIMAYVLIAAATHAIVPFDRLVAAEGSFINPFQFIGLGTQTAASVFAVVAFVSMIGALSASIMAQPRLEYAIARDGLFFPVFGHLHPRYLTPDYAILIQSGLALLLFVLGGLENMLGYFTLSYALQNSLLYGSIIFLRKHADYRPAYRVPLGRTLAVVSILLTIGTAAATALAYPAAGLVAALGLILSGLPVYLFMTRRKPA